MSVQVTVYFAAPPGYQVGDYVKLFSNGGSGDIDYDTPVSNARLPLLTARQGYFGWRHLPWRHFPWRRGVASRCSGWRHLPWRHFPWRHGTLLISAKIIAEGPCGQHKFAFVAYDKLGNPHEGSPQEVTVGFHSSPPAPTGLQAVSYNKNTKILTLEAA